MKVTFCSVWLMTSIETCISICFNSTYMFVSPVEEGTTSPDARFYPFGSTWWKVVNRNWIQRIRYLISSNHLGDRLWFFVPSSVQFCNIWSSVFKKYIWWLGGLSRGGPNNNVIVGDTDVCANSNYLIYDFTALGICELVHIILQ